MGVLAGVLWDHPDQRESVAAIVGNVASGVVGDATKIQDLVLELVQKLPQDGNAQDQNFQAQLVACNKEGNNAIRKLRGLRDQVKNDRKRAKIDAMISKIEGALGPVREQARQALGL